MGGYSEGFRDGAAAATEAQAVKFQDAISDVKDDPHAPLVYTRDRVIELLQLLARQAESLAARIMEVDTHETGEGDANQGEESSD